MLWLSADTSSSSSSSSVLLAFSSAGITHLFSLTPFFSSLCQSIKAWTKTALKCQKKMPQKKKGNSFLPNFGNHPHTPNNNNTNNNNPKKPTYIIHMYNKSRIKLSSCLEDICNFDEL
jgi:hypothetical protein